MCGISEYLINISQNYKIVGVDTFGSILFGLPSSIRLLRGLGNSILPANLLHNYFDEIHWINHENAYLSTLELYKRFGLFRGPTSGACYHIANWLSQRNNERKYLFLSPDSGYRYINSVYNSKDEKNWIKNNEPNILNSIKEPGDTWSCYTWNKKELSEIL